MAIAFVGNESQVNTTATGNQRAAATTALLNGGYVTVWASDTGDGSGKAIMGQLFAADGSKVGAEFLVNTTTAGDQDLPDVIAYDDSSSFGGGVRNSFIVVWQSAEANGSVIRGRRFLENGTPAIFSPRDQANQTDSDVLISGEFGGSKPSAGFYGSGRLAIVWQAPSGDGDGTAIAMAHYRSGLGPPRVVNTTTAGNQVDPRIADRLFGAAIVWESQEPGGDVIRGRIYNQTGFMGTNDAVLSQAAGEDESLPNVAEQGTLVIWNSGTNIMAREVGTDPGGSTTGVGSAFILNTTPGGVISRSDIMALDNNTFLAVYFTQSGDDGSSYSIRAEYFSRSLGPQSAEVLVPQSFAGAQEAPSIVLLKGGNIVVTWASEADALGNFEIKQRLLVLNGVNEGDAGDNAFAGTPDQDLFLLHQGGNDTALGYQSNDRFVFRAAMTSQDKVDGGDGTDLVILQGDYSNGLTLGPDTIVGVEKLRVLRGDNTDFGDTAGNHYSYEIATVDLNVARGGRLVVQGGSLRVGETFSFDGSDESDGSFQVFGGRDDDRLEGGAQFDHLLGRAGDDELIGNGGNDRLRGGLGQDVLEGGAGADILVYSAQGGAEGYANAVLESTGGGYDILVGFDYGEDRIDLPNAVTGLSTDSTGKLDEASFDSDLAAALGSFQAGSAVLFTPDSGDLATRHFLIVDANGDGAYQADLDFVFELQAPVGALPPTPDFFI